MSEDNNTVDVSKRLDDLEAQVNELRERANTAESNVVDMARRLNEVGGYASGRTKPVADMPHLGKDNPALQASGDN